jgi:hypothetical protein
LDDDCIPSLHKASSTASKTPQQQRLWMEVSARIRCRGVLLQSA